MQEAEDRHRRQQEGDFGPDSRVVAYYSPGLEPVGPERYHEALHCAGRAFVLRDRRQALHQALERRQLCPALPRRQEPRAHRPRRRPGGARKSSGLDPPSQAKVTTPTT